ncbi:MAG TPA: CAP domain-containing protein [Gammaproteobacteria bacterium]|nr:CAP domain-containing protein [Gammaproteobacteria bacterium]
MSLFLTRVAVAAFACVALAPAARADPLAAVNALRAKGCAKQAAVGTPLKRDAALDGVARELARDNRLVAAVAKINYPAEASTSFHVKGARDDAAVQRVLAERYCAAINDAKYVELGAYQKGDETWIVLARRQPQAPVLAAAAVERRVLALVNEARAAGRKCGRETYAAAPPLTPSATLTAAAAAHALDMAAHRKLDHTGSDGSSSGERATRAGYLWQAVGENIAAGQKDADAVVAAWLESPGHCATLMGPYFTEMGVAFSLAPGANPGIYWAQELAAPR